MAVFVACWCKEALCQPAWVTPLLTGLEFASSLTILISPYWPEWNANHTGMQSPERHRGEIIGIVANQGAVQKKNFLNCMEMETIMSQCVWRPESCKQHWLVSRLLPLTLIAIMRYYWYSEGMAKHDMPYKGLCWITQKFARCSCMLKMNVIEA